MNVEKSRGPFEIEGGVQRGAMESYSYMNQYLCHLWMFCKTDTIWTN